METTFFQNVFTPLMLSTASLLVMLTTRNANLSDRVRDATRLINDDHPDMKPLRRANLLDQIGSFHQRYILNELALAAMACALVLFLSMNLFAGSRNLMVATVLFSCGLIALAFGFLLTGTDIMRGMKTLDLELQYARDEYEPPAQYRDAWKQDIVHRLQTDTEFAQTVRDALREASVTEPSK
jgi:hypothetical protein